MHVSSTLVTHVVLVAWFYQILGINVVFDSFWSAGPALVLECYVCYGKLTRFCNFLDRLEKINCFNTEKLLGGWASGIERVRIALVVSMPMEVYSSIWISS
jgi:hypothetical protein